MISLNQESSVLSRDGKLQIPKFTSTLPYYTNPFGKQPLLMKEWMDWMFPFSLLSESHFDRRIREASTMTSIYFFPFCKDIMRFERIVKWTAYLFICDDHIEHGRNTETADEVVNQSMDCIRRLEVMHVNGGEHNISLLGFRPFILCAYFVAEEILLDMNMKQRKRFIEVWRCYCLANTKEHELIKSQLLDLDAINKVRAESGAMKTSFALFEYAVKIDITDRLWHDDRIQRLMVLSNLCVIYVNDVYSFEKEYVEQNEDMTKMIVNIVGYHVLKYKCSIEEAFERSLDMIRGFEREYKELADSLANDRSLTAECKTFIDCVTAATGGNFGLSIHCNRYNDIYETKE